MDHSRVAQWRVEHLPEGLAIDESAQIIASSVCWR
jgi:hypothetical protein